MASAAVALGVVAAVVVGGTIWWPDHGSKIDRQEATIATTTTLVSSQTSESNPQSTEPTEQPTLTTMTPEDHADRSEIWEHNEWVPPNDDAAQFEDGLIIVGLKSEPVELTSTGIGEVSGPGVAITISVRNDGPEPIDLIGVSVNLVFNDRPAAVPYFSNPAEPFVGLLEPGQETSGRYLFRGTIDNFEGSGVEFHHLAPPRVMFLQFFG